MKRLPLALLIAAPLALGGCNNNPTAPAEDAPAVSDVGANESPRPPDPRIPGFEKAIGEALNPRPVSVKVTIIAPPTGAKGAVPSESARVDVQYADEHSFGFTGLHFDASGPTRRTPGLRSGVVLTRQNEKHEVQVGRFLFDSDGKVLERDWDDEHKEKEAGVEKRCRDILEAMRKAFAK